MSREMNQDQFSLDRMAQDPKNWRGPFYGCRKDPRLFVPKSDPFMGWGWTPNLLNPYTYLIVIGIILATVIVNHLR